MRKIKFFFKDHFVSIIVIACIAFGIIFTCSIISKTATWQRFKVDVKSDFNGGIERDINIYTANGDLLAHYEGKIDLEANSGGYVKFDLDGKRYIYYNCFVETIAEID